MNVRGEDIDPGDRCLFRGTVARVVGCAVENSSPNAEG
jgi:hypothetical protein